MADEYIRKADALNASKITYIECLYLDDGGYLEGESDAIPVVFKRDIEAIPATDVRHVVHGRWKSYGIGKGKKFCSNCEYNGEKAMNFCPKCGADMREVRNG